MWDRRPCCANHREAEQAASENKNTASEIPASNKILLVLSPLGFIFDVTVFHGISNRWLIIAPEGQPDDSQGCKEPEATGTPGIASKKKSLPRRGNRTLRWSRIAELRSPSQALSLNPIPLPLPGLESLRLKFDRMI